MSIIEIRAELHKLIDQMDERFLRAVYLMICAFQGKGSVIGFDIDGTPRTSSELTAILDNEVEAASRGEYISVEELANRSKQWITRTKRNGDS